MNEKETMDVRDYVPCKMQVQIIVQGILPRRKECFSQEEIAGHLEVDRRKIIELERGNCNDINLLENYCAILGKHLVLTLTDK